MTPWKGSTETRRGHSHTSPDTRAQTLTSPVHNGFLALPPASPVLSRACPSSYKSPNLACKATALALGKRNHNRRASPIDVSTRPPDAQGTLMNKEAAPPLTPWLNHLARGWLNHAQTPPQAPHPLLPPPPPLPSSPANRTCHSGRRPRARCMLVQLLTYRRSS